MSLQDLDQNIKHKKSIDNLINNGYPLDNPIYIESLLSAYNYGPGEGKSSATEALLIEAFKTKKHAYTTYYAEALASATAPLNLIATGFDIQDPMRLFLSRFNLTIPTDIQAGALLRHWVDTKKLIPRLDLYTLLISKRSKETSALLAPIEEQQGLPSGTLLSELKQQLLHDVCKHRLFESRDRWDVLSKHTDVSTLSNVETANFIRNVYHGIDVSIFEYDGTHAVTMMDLTPLSEKQQIMNEICNPLPGWSRLKALVDTQLVLGMSVERIYENANYMAELLNTNEPHVECPEFTL